MKKTELNLKDYEDHGDFWTVALEKNGKRVDFTMHKEYKEWGLCCQIDEDGTEYTDNWTGVEWAAQRLDVDPSEFWQIVTPRLEMAIA